MPVTSRARWTQASSPTGFVASAAPGGPGPRRAGAAAAEAARAPRPPPGPGPGPGHRPGSEPVNGRHGASRAPPGARSAGPLILCADGHTGSGFGRTGRFEPDGLTQAVTVWGALGRDRHGPVTVTATLPGSGPPGWHVRLGASGFQ
jgi:hypothetical protein